MTSVRPNLAAEIEQRIAPVTLAEEELLPVPAALADLFPRRGLQRGWSVGFSGHGGWSLALAMLGAATGGDGWAAAVGLEELGLVAGEELGLGLDRILMVEAPDRDTAETGGTLATVVASLIEVMDVVCLGRIGSVGIRDGRRLMARAREQDAVLFHLPPGPGVAPRCGPPPWPHPMDVMIHTEVAGWSGIGVGHGHLATRQVAVTATGRRSMARPRRVEVLLPGPDGVPTPVPVRGQDPGPVRASAQASGKQQVGAWPVSA